jgi:hypothetical protein
MIRYGTVLGLAAGLVAFGQGHLPAVGATSLVGVSPRENTIIQGVVNAPEPARPASPVAAERQPRGNPLWAVPVRSLSVTRERPIFSPSRRPPPPPAVVATPQLPPVLPAPQPPEPDHPLLTLVGTVVGETDGIGVFFDQSAKSIIRLRAGEGYSGWILRSVQGREARFEKNLQAATLALPPHGTEQAGQMPITTSGNTRAAVDGDGQTVRPPLARISQPSIPPPFRPVAQVIDDDLRGDSGGRR